MLAKPTPVWVAKQTEIKEDFPKQPCCCGGGPYFLPRKFLFREQPFLCWLSGFPGYIPHKPESPCSKDLDEFTITEVRNGWETTAAQLKIQAIEGYNTPRLAPPRWPH